MTDGDAIKQFTESARRTEEYMSKISNGIEKMNDTNILHARAIDVFKGELQRNNTILKEQVDKNTIAINSFLSFNKYVFLLLIGALIILSGAEKVLSMISP